VILWSLDVAYEFNARFCGPCCENVDVDEVGNWHFFLKFDFFSWTKMLDVLLKVSCGRKQSILKFRFYVFAQRDSCRRSKWCRKHLCFQDSQNFHKPILLIPSKRLVTACHWNSRLICERSHVQRCWSEDIGFRTYLLSNLFTFSLGDEENMDTDSNLDTNFKRVQSGFALNWMRTRSSVFLEVYTREKTYDQTKTFVSGFVKLSATETINFVWIFTSKLL